MGMREMLGAGDQRTTRFKKLAKGKTKEEVRELERTLLKPDVIPPFTGERPAKSSVEQRTVKIIFESDEDIDLFKHFFKVNTYKEQNTREIGAIVALVEAMDRGSLRYDQEQKTLNFVDDQGAEWPL